MEGRKFFNKKQLHFNLKLVDFVKNNFFGLGYFYVNSLEVRLEVLNQYPIVQYKNNKWVVLHNVLERLVPKKRSLERRLLLNVLFLDFIQSYRGYRHLFGLPTRGQRAWTNGNSVFRSNNILRNHKISIFKKSLSSVVSENVNSAHHLEQVNFLWRNQWDFEWVLAQRHHAVSLKKNKGFVKYDLSALSRANPNARDFKKQKLFSIGFDYGFTKNFLKNAQKIKSKK